MACKEQTLKFANSEDLHSKFKSLIVTTDSFDCRVEVYPEFYAVIVKFITATEEPELEIRVLKKTEDNRVPVDVIFTNKKEVRIEKLEPGAQYILQYRFNFSDGMNSVFFEEVNFKTLSRINNH